MFTFETLRDSEGRGWIVVRETHGWVDVAAHVISETYCNHETGRCLISPPAWTYWLGGHYRYSLGGLLRRLGQAVNQRQWSLTEVYRAPVTDRVLIEHFGWDAGVPNVG